MARHMRNGRDYSRPGPKVDYELRKDSNNAARSGEVYDKIKEIQSQIVPTASIESGAFASKAYNVGDFLVKDGTLFKVTNAIAKDNALTVGTNIAMTTVGSELSEKSKSSDRVQLSLDAVAVGKDEDGNTIYEKTFKGSTLSSGTVIDSTLTVSNLKWFHLVGGCFNNNNKSFNTIPNAQYFKIHSNNKGLVIEYSSDVGYNVKSYHLTVQYVLK